MKPENSNTRLGERVSALEAQVTSNEKATERASLLAERAQERADEAITKRFEAANEIRDAMKDQSRNFVTRTELYWAVALLVALIGALGTIVMIHNSLHKP